MPTRKWGSEQIVNSTITGNQLHSDVIALEGGGFVVVWEDASGADTRIMGQVFNEAGQEVGGEISLASDVGNDRINPSVAALADGTFYLTYEIVLDGGSNNDILGGVHAADGSLIAFQPVIFEFFKQNNPDVAQCGTGSAVVWETTASSGDIACRIFPDNGGTPIIFTANANTTGPQVNPAVACSPDGTKVAVVWQDFSSTGGDIKARRFTGDGTPITAEVTLNTTTNLTQGAPAITWLGQLNLAVAWVNEAVGGWSIKARVFDFNFIANTEEITVSFSQGAVLAPVISALPNGGFVVAWQDGSVGGDPSGSSIWAQAFDRAGHPVGGNMLVNTTTTGSQSSPTITPLADGRVVISWTDSSSGDNDIRMQIIDPRDGIVTGSASGETLYGHSQVADEISGLSGNDVLRGLAGNDALYGGEGNDTMVGGQGDDAGFGGTGNDTFDGSKGDDEFSGEAGNDIARVSLGEDTLNGGASIDTLDFSFVNLATGVTVDLTVGSFTLPTGDAQTFTAFESIIGTGFADTLLGSGGVNRLTGGAGGDTLTGRAGADIFAYRNTGDSTAAAAGRDRITDFTIASDRIDVSAIDAKAGTGGNQLFAFIGTSAFSAEGQVRVVQSGADAIVQFNTSGTTGTEMSILLQNVIAANVTSADFIL